MENKWKNQWKNIVGACVVAMVLVMGITVVGRTAISELAGLAVAQTNTLWNSVADAAKGDGLSSGIMAQSSYLFNGLTFDRLRGAPAADGATGTGLQATIIEVFNGTTYDRMRGGLTTDAIAGGTGLLNNGGYIFNGTTWDRMRGSITSDTQITGILASSGWGWNGANYDRLRTVSAINNTQTTAVGAVQVTLLSTWTQLNTTSAAATAATTSKASGGGSVRHVFTGFTACFFDTAANTAIQLVNLRDGATGAGTILKTWFVMAPAASTPRCENMTVFNITGSAATAMTLEFAANPAATASETVSFQGYSTP